MTRLSAATIRASEYTGHAIAVTSASTPRSTTTYPSSGTRPRSACPAAEMSRGTVRPTQLACRTEWVPSTMLMYSAVPPCPSTLRYADSPVSATSFSITGLARSTSDSLDSACAPSWIRRLPGRYVPPTSSLADEPGGLQRAQEPKCRARREIAIPGTVGEIRAAPVADGGEQGERAFHRPRGRFGHRDLLSPRMESTRAMLRINSPRLPLDKIQIPSSGNVSFR